MDLLRLEMEKRLHRVIINLDENKKINCQFAKICYKAEISYRCNNFFQKCAKFKGFMRL